MMDKLTALKKGYNKIYPWEEAELMPSDEVNEFTDLTGGNGKWQKRMLAIFIVATIITPMNHLGMTFLAFPVDHWCARPEGLNISVETWWAENLPNATVQGKWQHSQCEMYAENRTGEVTAIKKIVKCDKWEYADNYNSLVQYWNLVCDDEWMISISSSIYMLGFLFAVLISGQISDIYGRHPATLMNVFLINSGGICTVFGNSFILFSIGRFVTGMGHAGMNLVLIVLLIELVDSSSRAKYFTLETCGWMIGYLLFPVIAWLIKDWFYLQLTITTPCLALFSLHWLIPESPRWLISNGKTERATEIIRKAAEINGIEVKDVDIQVKQLYLKVLKQQKQAKAKTFVDLMRSAILRRKTFYLYFIWMVIAFTYYGLALHTNDLDGDPYLNFFLSAVVEIPSLAVCYFTMDHYGRKSSFFIFLIAGGVASLAIVFVPQRFASISTALSFLGKFFTNGSFTIVYVFSSEIFPTVVRNIGLGSCSTMARIALTATPFMSELANATTQWAPYAIYGFLSIISGLLVLLIPETNKKAIPETIEEAENFEKITTDKRDVELESS